MNDIMANMALQTNWIRKHMLQTPNPDIAYPERRMSENELRVMRSIQKLSIPEWYLNNSSRPPKILANNTPIDRRPAPWKNVSINKPVFEKTTMLEPKNLTVCLKDTLETEIESSSKAKKKYGTFEIPRNAATKKSLSLVRQDVPPINQNLNKNRRKSKIITNSQTFPRLSPSRKIQNINIVFPQEMAEMENLATEDLDDSEEKSNDNMTKDSTDDKKTEKNDDYDAEIWVSPDEIFSGNFGREIAWMTEEWQNSMKIDFTSETAQKKVNSRRSSICVLPMKSSAAKAEPKEEYEREPLKTPPPLSPQKTFQEEDERPATHPPEEKIGLEQQQSVSIKDLETVKAPQPARRVSRFRPKPDMLEPIPEKATDTCLLFNGPIIEPNKTPSSSLQNSTLKSVNLDESIKADESSKPLESLVIDVDEKINDESTSSPLHNSTSKSVNLDESIKADEPSKPCESPVIDVDEKINEECTTVLESTLELISDESKDSSSESDEGNTYSIEPLSSSSSNSTLKSVDLDESVESLEPSEPRKSFVREIIDELNQRCNTISKSTYVSPNSKNFVKKLVKELEHGGVPSTEQIEKKQVSYKKSLNFNAETDLKEEDVFISGESDDEIKSVAISTSISYERTDSSSSNSSESSNKRNTKSNSNTNPGSATTMNNYRQLMDFFSRNINNDDDDERDPNNNNDDQMTNKNYEETEAIEEEEDDEDEWIYWNQKVDWNLPRTSSLLSVSSKISPNTVDNSSPCISPIDPPSDLGSVFSSRSGKSSSGTWRTTYKTRRSDPYTFYYLNNTNIFDSGFSERSSSFPSRSTQNKNFFNYTGTTLTASENSYCNETHQRSITPGQQRGRAFGLPIAI